MQQTTKLISKQVIQDLQSFIDNAAYLVTSKEGDKTIQRRITRLYNRLSDTKTPKDQLPAIYKLLAAYALLGMQRENLEISGAKR
jgi:hypothetical protein